MPGKRALSTETEAKLGVWPGFVVPELHGVAPWATADEPHEVTLDAVYHDAADLRLTRAGITVRHRTGEDGAEDGRWTAKIPHPPTPSGAVTRSELKVDGPPGSLPPEIHSVLKGVLRGAAVGPVAHLRTHRRIVVLRDGGGREAAEVADDEVSVLESDRVAARFREVEVEMSEGAPDGLLPLVLDALRAAGAGDPEQTPKLVRALGPRAVDAADPAVPPLGSKPTAAEAVQVALAASVQRLIAHDPAVRLDIGPFGVHQARVSTRRLRSDLRSYEELLDARWASDLRDRLKWLADALGNVRDTDVLGMRLRKDADTLDRADAAQARHLLKRLERQRAAKLRALDELMDSDQYVELLDTLVHSALEPRFSPRAGAPAVQAMAELARAPWKKLQKAAEKLDKHATDQELHELRIKAKRARYAAEAAAGAIPAAREHAEALAELQGVLGDQHDAVVAEDWLRREVGLGASRLQAMAAGLLITMQRDDAAHGRDEWMSVWHQCNRKKVTAWLAS